MSERMANGKPLLEVNNLCIRFGGLKAVDDVSFQVWPGEIVGLIGPNGAGKTTVFNLLTRVYNPTSGEIRVDGQSTFRLAQHRTVDAGLARTFQNIRLFRSMTALENVKSGFQHGSGYGITAAVLRTKTWKHEEADVNERSMRLLRLFGMEKQADSEAGSLPYGMQRKLEICRALATRPRLLLLDEPAAGMNPTETHALMNTIGMIRKEFAMTILLIEHDMSLVMGICQRIIVLNYGRVLAVGDPEQIRSNTQVIEAYLGSGGAEHVAVG